MCDMTVLTVFSVGQKSLLFMLCLMGTYVEYFLAALREYTYLSYSIASADSLASSQGSPHPPLTHLGTFAPSTSTTSALGLKLFAHCEVE